MTLIQKREHVNFSKVFSFVPIPLSTKQLLSTRQTNAFEKGYKEHGKEFLRLHYWVIAKLHIDPTHAYENTYKKYGQVQLAFS